MSITELHTGLLAAALGGDESTWRTTRYPGVSWRQLHLADASEGGDATVLIRMEPGSSYPEHEHLGVEEVLILAGGYRDADGEHRAGSYLRYPAGSRHAPIAIGDPRAAEGPANPACVLFALAHGGVRTTSRGTVEMNNESYFDYNASTPVDARVLEAGLRWMNEGYANASSSHPEGRRAAAAILRAASSIADGIGARAHEIFFTSGGSEANNWALSGSARAAGHGHIVTSAIEHKSVLSTVRDLERHGLSTSSVAPHPDGAVRVEDIAALLRNDTILVSIMVANNETGVIQPVEAIGELCRKRGVRFHVDAVGALGKHELDVRAIGCDLLSLSSHKMYSPKGCGVLFVREGTKLEPLIHGCGQQAGMRGGTENTAGAVAFGCAFERLREGAFGSQKTIAALRDQLFEKLQAKFGRLERNGSAACLPNTLNVAFPGVDASKLVASLGARGFSVSAGAAGAGGATSHVLDAMGLGEARARSSLRLSLGAHSTLAGVCRLVEALEQCIPVSESAPSR